MVRMVHGTNSPMVRMVHGTNGPWYEWSMVRFFENRALGDLGDLLAFLIVTGRFS